LGRGEAGAVGGKKRLRRYKMSKFLGVGLKQAIALCIFFWIMTVITKVGLTKYPVSGLSEFIQSV